MHFEFETSFCNLRIHILQSILKYHFLSGKRNFLRSMIQISQITNSSWDIISSGTKL